MTVTQSNLRVVVIGGGTGCPAVMQGLSPYAFDLSAVVTVMDSGGSTGRLRQEFGIPALGDIRRCLSALAAPDAATELFRDLMEYRFGGDAALGDHSLGNLLLAALVDKAGGLEEGIRTAAGLLGLRATVLPVTLASTHLVGVLQDGTTLEGEAAIDQRGAHAVGVQRVLLDPKVDANPRAVEAILDADVVVLGPGDLYTSVIPNLLVRGIPEALRSTQATRVFIGNLVTKPGETEGYRLSDFLRETLRYVDTAEPFDLVLADSVGAPAPADADHPSAGSPAVAVDAEACVPYARRVIVRPLASSDAPWLHDPQKIGHALREALQALAETRLAASERGFPS